MILKFVSLQNNKALELSKNHVSHHKMGDYIASVLGNSSYYKLSPHLKPEFAYFEHQLKDPQNRDFKNFSSYRLLFKATYGRVIHCKSLIRELVKSFVARLGDAGNIDVHGFSFFFSLVCIRPCYLFEQRPSFKIDIARLFERHMTV